MLYDLQRIPNTYFNINKLMGNKQICILSLNTTY